MVQENELLGVELLVRDFLKVTLQIFPAQAIIDFLIFDEKEQDDKSLFQLGLCHSITTLLRQRKALDH
jgi:hypothetical protein